MATMHTPIRAAALGLAAWLAAQAMPAAAQQGPPEIRVGQTIHAALTDADPVMTGRGAFRVYRLEGRQGQRLVATLRSGAFDALLTLMRPVAGITEVLDSDDDGAGGTDSRLRFNVPATGTYLLMAQSLEAGGLGGYTLLLEEAPAPRRAMPQPLRIGETRHGTLDENAPILELERGEVFYHLYGIEARAGQELVIGLESGSFDAFLAFGPLHDGEVEVAAFDDDGGEGANARLRVSVPADGRYGIQVRPYSGLATGPYTLSVREIPVTAPTALLSGQEASGQLGDDERDADHRYFQQWSYRAAGGETVRIRMRSDEFDTMLVLGRLEGGVFRELVRNDDSGDDGSNSFIEYHVPAAGELRIRATSFDGGATGRYTLRLDAVR
jgi:hypothetical protein